VQKGFRMKKDTMVLAVKNFPVDLYQKIKSQATREHRTLKGLVILALKEYIERHRESIPTKRQIQGLVQNYFDAWSEYRDQKSLLDVEGKGTPDEAWEKYRIAADMLYGKRSRGHCEAVIRHLRKGDPSYEYQKLAQTIEDRVEAEADRARKEERS
jgi:hypothetical protein